MTKDEIHMTKSYSHRRVPFESKKPRERSACPKCNSILVKKRRRTNDYICDKCKWEGVTVIKIMW